MSEFTIRTPNRTFRVRTGSEGPRHDPYSFTEYTITRKGKATVTYHCGLGEWLAIGKRRMKNFVKAEQRLNWCDRERAAGRRLRRAFARYSGGLSPEQIEKCHDRIVSRCDCCGCRHTEAQRGFPGETLYVCTGCGEILGGDFNRSAIE